MENNAQGKAPGTRSAEGSQAGSVFDEGREEGAGGNGVQHERFGIRANGTIGSGQTSDAVQVITGGIITRLIKDAEDQLGEAIECIEWYERKRQEQLERLEDLRKLQQLGDKEQQAQHIEESETTEESE